MHESVTNFSIHVSM